MAHEWTPEQRRIATEQICIGGNEDGAAFFARHPYNAFEIAVDLQCEINEARELLDMSVMDENWWEKRDAWLSRNPQPKETK